MELAKQAYCEPNVTVYILGDNFFDEWQSSATSWMAAPILIPFNNQTEQGEVGDSQNTVNFMLHRRSLWVAEFIGCPGPFNMEDDFASEQYSVYQVSGSKKSGGLGLVTPSPPLDKKIKHLERLNTFL